MTVVKFVHTLVLISNQYNLAWYQSTTTTDFSGLIAYGQIYGLQVEDARVLFNGTTRTVSVPS